jgi:hypothetical protein
MATGGSHVIAKWILWTFMGISSPWILDDLIMWTYDLMILGGLALMIITYPWLKSDWILVFIHIRLPMIIDQCFPVSLNLFWDLIDFLFKTFLESYPLGNTFFINISVVDLGLISYWMLAPFHSFHVRLLLWLYWWTLSFVISQLYFAVSHHDSRLISVQRWCG